MGIYNMYGRQLQYHCNKILSSVHNGLSTKAEGLLTKVRATTQRINDLYSKSVICDGRSSVSNQVLTFAILSSALETVSVLGTIEYGVADPASSSRSSVSFCSPSLLLADNRSSISVVLTKEGMQTPLIDARAVGLTSA